jgi:hypothetical protein
MADGKPIFKFVAADTRVFYVDWDKKQRFSEVKQ